MINLISLGGFSIIRLIKYIVNIATLLYFYSYYESLKDVKMEDKKELEGIGISNIKNQSINNETRHKIYEVYCNNIIQSLKAPATAVFCKEEELTIKKEYGRYIVNGWVDSQNSYGAMIRTDFNKFIIEEENGIFIAKSNSGVMAGNKFVRALAGYWIYGIIATLITGAVFYFIMQATM